MLNTCQLFPSYLSINTSHPPLLPLCTLLPFLTALPALLPTFLPFLTIQVTPFALSFLPSLLFLQFLSHPSFLSIYTCSSPFFTPSFLPLLLSLFSFFHVSSFPSCTPSLTGYSGRQPYWSGRRALSYTPTPPPPSCLGNSGC